MTTKYELWKGVDRQSHTELIFCILVTQANDSAFISVCVCLSVGLMIRTKTAESRITKSATEIVHHEPPQANYY